MSCNIPPEILEYIEQVENNAPRACKEQHALVALIRRVFATEDIYVETERMRKYFGIARYFPYDRLFPWQTFALGLWLCTYRRDGSPRFKTLFAMVERGAGKDGVIAISSAALISPYNPVPHYNVDICANNEEQAVTPVKDIVEALENPKWEAKLSRFYYHTKEVLQGRKNLGEVKGRTNNPKGRDGMRSGAVIFNEVHQYQNYDNIKVFITGQGKVAEPRVGFFTSNGDVSDGPLDDYLARGRRILFEGEPDEGFLPFICCLNTKDEVHDENNWCMANPSLPYLPHLMQEIRDEYRDWLERPEQNGDFMTKRMGIRYRIRENKVTEYENTLAANRPLPDMAGWSCTVGIDYAELDDWAAVDLHFRKGDQRYDINHAWICANSKTLPRVKAPWRTWCENGDCTYVDDVSISPYLLTDFIREAGRKYTVKKVALDHFRYTMMAEALQSIGFDAKDKNRVKLVRPSDIMQVDPVIQDCFNRNLFTWGDVPHLRWAVNNTKRVRSSRSQGVDTGNFIYAKIEGKSRKTDPFMALAAAMTVESDLGTGQVQLPKIGAFCW